MKTLLKALRHLIPYYAGLLVGVVSWGNVVFEHSSLITRVLVVVVGLLVGYNFSKEGA